jgi:hypothetical protein
LPLPKYWVVTVLLGIKGSLLIYLIDSQMGQIKMAMYCKPIASNGDALKFILEKLGSCKAN